MTLRNVWKRWLKISEFIGNILSRAILTILYFTLFAIPSAFLSTIADKFGKSFSGKKETYYIYEKITVENLEEAKL